MVRNATMKQISRIGFDSETPMEETILRQSIIDGIHFIDFKADIGTVFTRKADLAAFSQNLTWWAIVEVEHHTHPASHVVGQLAELATLLMLNDDLQQRSIEWLRAEMKAKKAHSSFLTENWSRVRQLVSHNAPFLILISDKLAHSWLAGLEVLGPRAKVFEYQEFAVSFGEGHPPKTIGSLVGVDARRVFSVSEVIKAREAKLFHIRQPHSIGLLGFEDEVTIEYNGERHSAMIYSHQTQAVRNNLFFAFDEDVKVRGVRLVLRKLSEGVFRLDSNDKRM